jgi:hypothetical protein
MERANAISMGISHRLSAAIREKAVSTSLRLITVLDVLLK